MKLNDASGPGRESALPPIADIAAEIRKGADIADICQQYQVSRSTLQNRFQLAGYSLSTGEQHQPRHARPTPLQSQHVGAGGQHVGGGDYQGLPTTPVKYRDKPSRTGIDWDQVRETYLSNGGQVDDSVWHQGKVVVIGSNSARSSRANIHSFEEASEYNEPAAKPKPKPRRTTTPSKTNPSAKLTQDQRVQIGRRYRFGESLMELAKAYGVTVTTITKTLAAQGVPTRTRQEAGKVRREGGVA